MEEREEERREEGVPHDKEVKDAVNHASADNLFNFIAIGKGGKRLRRSFLSSLPLLVRHGSTRHGLEGE